MSNIVKSIRIENTKLIADFIAAQKNFSKSIRFLILNYCSQHGIRDLSSDAMLDNLVMSQKTDNQTENIAMEKVNSVSVIRSDELKNVDTKKSVSSIKKTKGRTKEENPDEAIPDCYLS